MACGMPELPGRPANGLREVGQFAYTLLFERPVRGSEFGRKWVSAVIRIERLAGTGGASMREVMKGEIAGLTCFFHSLPEGGLYTPPVSERASRVFFFVEGRGSIECGDRSHTVTEIALFAPGHQAASAIRASGPLSFLELSIDLAPADVAWAAEQKVKPPYFAAYSDCKTYREAIKSEKTVSRTLLPANIIPRFCAGSVQTSGPDRVAAHRHGMLEQLFFGLPENDCVVQADEASCPFGGSVLLHIPLGSEHSVRVAPGKPLHYIWIDLFRINDFSWITQNHLENKP